MDEERKRILKMIEEGRLSAEEGASLLEALESGEKGARSAAGGPGAGDGKLLRIRIVDGVTGREKVNLNVPIGLAKMVSALIPEAQRENLEEHGVHIEDLLRAVEKGEVGRVVEIKNNDTGEEVDISIE